MAGIRARQRKDGTSTYRVVWRPGGHRSGAQQSETFSTRKQAINFQALVEDAGNHWPKGWVKGYGFADGAPNHRIHRAPFEDVAGDYLATLYDVQGDTLARYRSQPKTLAKLFPYIGDVIKDAIARWTKERLDGGAKPKTVGNYHGLLSSVCDYAVEQSLLEVNPCARTRLPKRRPSAEERWNKFLESEEVGLILSAVHPDSKDIVRVAYGTGMRYGEIAGLQVRDVNRKRSRLHVQRSLKRNEHSRWYLGDYPKTDRSNRVLSLDPAIMTIVARHTDGKGPMGHVSTAPEGGHLRHGDFYELRWQPAVRAARDKGLQKRPKFHTLRHSYASALLDAGIPLTVVSARLGHASLQITADTYGHLLDLDRANDAVDAAVSTMMAELKEDEEPAPE